MYYVGKPKFPLSSLSRSTFRWTDKLIEHVGHGLQCLRESDCPQPSPYSLSGTVDEFDERQFAFPKRKWSETHLRMPNQHQSRQNMLNYRGSMLMQLLMCSRDFDVRLFFFLASELRHFLHCPNRSKFSVFFSEMHCNDSIICDCKEPTAVADEIGGQEIRCDAPACNRWRWLKKSLLGCVITYAVGKNVD